MSEGDDGPQLVVGRHPVREALEAGEAIERLLIAEGAQAHGTLADILRMAVAAGVPVQHVPRAALDRVVAGNLAGRHQGVVAWAAAYRYADLAEILARAIRAGEPPFVLLLDSIQDVHNVGALLRSAEAAGVHGVVLSDRYGAGISAAVRKTSAGAAAHLAVARADLPEAMDALGARGVGIAGLAADGAVPYDRADLAGPLAIAVGGEQRGLRPAVRRRCHFLLRLPMRGRVTSLNAGVAGSIALYEALRQRLAAREVSPGAAAAFDTEGPDD